MMCPVLAEGVRSTHCEAGHVAGKPVLRHCCVDSDEEPEWDLDWSGGLPGGVGQWEGSREGKDQGGAWSPALQRIMRRG